MSKRTCYCPQDAFEATLVCKQHTSGFSLLQIVELQPIFSQAKILLVCFLILCVPVLKVQMFVLICLPVCLSVLSARQLCHLM